MKSLNMHFYKKDNAGTYPITCDYALREKKNKDFITEILYGIDIKGRRFSFGSVFYNKEKNELVIASSLTYYQNQSSQINGLVAFGFLVVKVYELKVFLSTDFERFNVLSLHAFNPKMKNRFTFSSILSYLKENELKYLGNLILNNNKTNHLKKFLMENFDVSEDNILHFTKVLEQYNKRITFYKEVNHKWEYFLFDDISMSNIYSEKDTALYPKLSMILQKERKATHNILGVQKSIGFIGNKKPDFEEEQKIILYDLNDDYQASIYLDEHRHITTQRDFLTYDDFEKYTRILYRYQRYDNIYESNEKYDDYILYFI